MGIASIARYSLAMIQRSSDSAFAGGRDLTFAIAAFTRGSVIGGCVCKWQFLRVAAFARGVFLRMAALSPNRM